MQPTQITLTATHPNGSHLFAVQHADGQFDYDRRPVSLHRDARDRALDSILPDDDGAAPVGCYADAAETLIDAGYTVHLAVTPVTTQQPTQGAPTVA